MYAFLCNKRCDVITHILYPMFYYFLSFQFSHLYCPGNEDLSPTSAFVLAPACCLSVLFLFVLLLCFSRLHLPLCSGPLLVARRLSQLIFFFLPGFVFYPTLLENLHSALSFGTNMVCVFAWIHMHTCGLMCVCIWTVVFSCHSFCRYA